MAEITQEEKCKIAFVVGLEKIIEACGGREGKEHVLKELSDILGIEGNPLSAKVESILEEGLTKSRCYDFRGIRQWVMARTWQIIETEHKRFKDAIRQAWDEARRTCAEHGAYI